MQAPELHDAVLGIGRNMKFAEDGNRHERYSEARSARVTRVCSSSAAKSVLRRNGQSLRPLKMRLVTTRAWTEFGSVGVGRRTVVRQIDKFSHTPTHPGLDPVFCVLCIIDCVGPDLSSRAATWWERRRERRREGERKTRNEKRIKRRKKEREKERK